MSADEAYSDYDDGFRDGYNDRASEPMGEAIAEALRRSGFNILEGVCVRWDAAERVLVAWDLNGNETRIS